MRFVGKLNEPGGFASAIEITGGPQRLAAEWWMTVLPSGVAEMMPSIEPFVDSCGWNVAANMSELHCSGWHAPAMHASPPAHAPQSIVRALPQPSFVASCSQPF